MSFLFYCQSVSFHMLYIVVLWSTLSCPHVWNVLNKSSLLWAWPHPINWSLSSLMWSASCLSGSVTSSLPWNLNTDMFKVIVSPHWAFYLHLFSVVVNVMFSHQGHLITEITCEVEHVMASFDKCDAKRVFIIEARDKKLARGELLQIPVDVGQCCVCCVCLSEPVLVCLMKISVCAAWILCRRWGEMERGLVGTCG